MCDPVTIGLIVAGVGAGTNAVVANQQRQQAKGAQAQAEASAAKTQEQSIEAQNKANQKGPDVNSILAANSRNSGGGATLLTGPGGVDPSTLQLGKTTLLGGT